MKKAELEDFEVRASLGSPEKHNAFEIYSELVKSSVTDIKSRKVLNIMQTGTLKERLSAMTLLNEPINSTTLFRASDESQNINQLYWVASVRTAALVISSNENLKPFTSIDKQLARSLVQESANPKFILELPRILLDHGIILVYEGCPASGKVDGVTFRMSSGNPVIGISFRYKRLDYFWFTFLHELGHVALHYDQLCNPIIDDLETDEENLDEASILREKQANRFAKESIVDRAIWRSSPPKYSQDSATIIKFANSISVSPALIAGLLQKETGNYALNRELVDATDTRELVFGND